MDKRLKSTPTEKKVVTRVIDGDRYKVVEIPLLSETIAKFWPQRDIPAQSSVELVALAARQAFVRLSWYGSRLPTEDEIEETEIEEQYDAVT